MQWQRRCSPPPRAAETGDVTVSAHPLSIASTCLSRLLLLWLWWSVKLTEMYENNVQQNEQPHHTFFIITHNDYELNIGVKKKKKKGV